MKVAKDILSTMTKKASFKSCQFEILCIQTSFLDLAMQAFLSHLQSSQMTPIVQALEALTEVHKLTMNAKWHEVILNSEY